VERRPPEQLLQLRDVEVGKQRLAMRRAVQRRKLAGLAGHGDHVLGWRVVVDEERLTASRTA
jgi:hypothetical protein